jgi:uncharacterized membrane protein
MNSARTWLAVASLVGGILLAAWALASGQLLLALAGFALVFVFLYLAMEAMGKVGEPKKPIKPAANPAWSMKGDSPVEHDKKGHR